MRPQSTLKESAHVRGKVCQVLEGQNVGVTGRRRGFCLNTPMGSDIDGELKREMSLQMLENRTYLRFHSSKSEGHPAGATISHPGRDRCGIR